MNGIEIKNIIKETNKGEILNLKIGDSLELRRFKANIKRAEVFGYNIILRRINGDLFSFLKIEEGNREEYEKYTKNRTVCNVKKTGEILKK